MEKVCVILPAYNEEESIGQVIKEVRSLGEGYKILVVDNNSKDKTAIIARQEGANYLFIREQGKGCAVREALMGLPSTLRVAMLDADGSYPPQHLPELIGKLGKYDVVLGRRWRKEKGAMSLANRFGNRVLSLLATVLYQKKIRDLCTGYWVFSPLALRVLKDANLKSKGFTLEAEMFSILSRAGLSIGEVPIVYRPRGGTAKLHLLDGFRIAWCLVVRRVR